LPAPAQRDDEPRAPRLYRDFTTQEELDVQYDASRSVDDASIYTDFYVDQSRAARAELECRADIAFGPTLAERLDVFPAERPDAPILIFVHGGYWRSRSRKEFSFVARGPVSAGVSVVVTDYALCPSVTIDEVVRQTRAATAWVHAHARELGADPRRIHVAGHSAGAHLGAMLMATEWERDFGLPADLIKSGCLVSGLFDLAPVPYTWLQPSLQLTWGEVLRNSPIRRVPRVAGPLIVSYGEAESAEFRRQGDDYMRAWRDGRLGGELLVQPGKNHYTVVEGFIDARSPLCRTLLAQIEADSHEVSAPSRV
jgi:arylformamidase